jgi:fructokinase
MSAPLYGAIEAGGTKFICEAGYDPSRPLQRVTVPTTTPERTLAAVTAFFAEVRARHGPIAGAGIASFGPIELDRRAAGWGRILATPKAGWSGADLAGTAAAATGAAVEVDTDVNAAALAEALAEPGAELRTLAYVTVGTGIGGGAVVHGRTLSGLLHPEMGHLRVRRADGDRDFPGVCPFHGDCLEGLASGPAITARWGRRFDELPDDHPALPVLGDYLGQLAASITLVLAAERIAFGGGVMADGRLLPYVRAAAQRQLAGYLRPDTLGDFSALVTAPRLGDRAGISGAWELARRAAA